MWINIVQSIISLAEVECQKWKETTHYWKWIPINTIKNTTIFPILQGVEKWNTIQETEGQKTPWNRLHSHSLSLSSPHNFQLPITIFQDAVKWYSTAALSRQWRVWVQCHCIVWQKSHCLHLKQHMWSIQHLMSSLNNLRASQGSVVCDSCETLRVMLTRQTFF